MTDRLDLDDIQQRPAVLKVRERVQALTSRPVIFRHMSQWRRTAPAQPELLLSPAMHPTDNSYDVYLNEVLPEQMAVHELLHIVLIVEGYPDIKFKEWKAPQAAPHRKQFGHLYDTLVNKLQHPEIYRRMSEEYNQNMPPYRAHVTTGLINETTFNLSRGLLSTPFGKQAALMDIIDHLYLQPESSVNLERYRSLAWDTYAVAKEIQSEMDKFGLKTPQAALCCMNIYLTHAIKYGKTIGVNKDDNSLWRALSWNLSNKNGSA